ncbi:MAG TPA: hypothetical protein VJJ82_04640 [Candidatus Nanoarchaeia archaeon]|nr:hypothetical protein [Candidatus Nanoarchaeia archaeon]
MRLTIDTTTDSQVEIRKAIKLLSSLINHQPLEEGFTNQEDSQKQPDVFSSPEPLKNIMSMFDSSDPKTKSKKEDDIPIMQIY